MGAHCKHNEAAPVLTIGKCEVWGGRQTQIIPIADKFECIISLLGPFSRKETKFSLSRGSRRTFRNLAAYQQRKNQVISIDWPDMQAPGLDRAFWEALAEDLAGITGKAAIFCIGGHGRTGTALSTLAHITNYAPAMDHGDVVQWIRDTYCPDAVETTSQVDYLRKVIGVKTAAQVHRGTGGYWGEKGSSPSKGVNSMFGGDLDLQQRLREAADYDE